MCETFAFSSYCVDVVPRKERSVREFKIYGRVRLCRIPSEGKGGRDFELRGFSLNKGQATAPDDNDAAAAVGF